MASQKLKSDVLVFGEDDARTKVILDVGMRYVPLLYQGCSLEAQKPLNELRFLHVTSPSGQCSYCANSTFYLRDYYDDGDDDHDGDQDCGGGGSDGDDDDDDEQVCIIVSNMLRPIFRHLSFRKHINRS